MMSQYLLIKALKCRGQDKDQFGETTIVEVQKQKNKAERNILPCLQASLNAWINAQNCPESVKFGVTLGVFAF